MKITVILVILGSFLLFSTIDAVFGDFYVSQPELFCETEGTNGSTCKDNSTIYYNGTVSAEMDPLWSGNASLYYLKSNPFAFYNSSTLPASNEVLWQGNSTLVYFKTNPLGFYNASTAKTTVEALWHGNSSLVYLASNPFGFYNSSTLPASSADGTGGWTNTSTTTSTSLNVNVSGNLTMRSGTATTLRLLSNGHIVSDGSSPTIHTGDCGTEVEGTVATGSTDVAGRVTIGTSGAAETLTCTVSFANTWGSAPVCMLIQDTTEAGGQPLGASTTTTSFTLVNGVDMGGTSFMYLCIGYQ